MTREWTRVYLTFDASASLAGGRVFWLERLAEQAVKRMEANLPVGFNLVRDRTETTFA